MTIRANMTLTTSRQVICRHKPALLPAALPAALLNILYTTATSPLTCLKKTVFPDYKNLRPIFFKKNSF